LQVRLSLSEDDEVYVNANEAFDPFEMELIKLSFLHLDCEHCGAVSMVEMYRYLLVSWYSPHLTLDLFYTFNMCL